MVRERIHSLFSQMFAIRSLRRIFSRQTFVSGRIQHQRPTENCRSNHPPTQWAVDGSIEHIGFRIRLENGFGGTRPVEFRMTIDCGWNDYSVNPAPQEQSSCPDLHQNTVPMAHWFCNLRSLISHELHLLAFLRWQNAGQLREWLARLEPEKSARQTSSDAKQ